MMGFAPPSFADSLREQFFRLGVPLIVQPAPDGGAIALGDFGESYHFAGQQDVQMFLLGFKLGQESAQLPEPRAEIPQLPPDAEYAGYRKETG